MGSPSASACTRAAASRKAVCLGTISLKSLMTSPLDTNTSASLPEPRHRPSTGELPFCARLMEPNIATACAAVPTLPPEELLFVRPRRLGDLRYRLANLAQVGGARLGGDVAQSHDADHVLIVVEHGEPSYLQGLHARQHFL